MSRWYGMSLRQWSMSVVRAKLPSLLTVAVFTLVVSLFLVLQSQSAEGNGITRGYPRLASLWGCDASSTDYARWAKYDFLIMGGSKESFRIFRKEIKKLNPNVVMFTTGSFGYVGAPKDTSWMKDEWYLRHPDGKYVSWWADKLFTPNITNDDCLNAMVEQSVSGLSDLIKEGVLDGVYYDSVVGRTGWLGDIDINRVGKADDQEVVDPVWHRQQCRFMDLMSKRLPSVLITANDLDLGHASHTNGRTFEGGRLADLMSYPMFSKNMYSPQEVIALLGRWMTESKQPGLTLSTANHPLGWQFWRIGTIGIGDKMTTQGEVKRAETDYPRMRRGLMTTIMTDAYFLYDFGTVWWGLPFWYAEYDAPLGMPLGKSHEVFLTKPKTVFSWNAGKSTKALILEKAVEATPNGLVAANLDRTGNWHQLLRTDPGKVHLKKGRMYRITADCEILRRMPDAVFQFDVRDAKTGTPIDKCIRQNEQAACVAENKWNIEFTAVPEKDADYILNWQIQQAGELLIKSVHINQIGDSYIAREFDGGIAVLNATPHAITIPLKHPMLRIKDNAAALHIVEVDDESKDFSTAGTWEIAGGEEHYYWSGYHKAKDLKASCAWEFDSPSTDTYTISTVIPGGKDRTVHATYTIDADETLSSVTIDQTKGDGGWTKLFDVKLRKGMRYTIKVVNSGGDGTLVGDAIRAESAARFNDGSSVKNVTLDPLDGTIMLNPNAK